MGLNASFDLLLRSDLPLGGLDDLIWKNLVDGAESSTHPWNLGSFSTIWHEDGSSPRPQCRTVVLRDANQTRRSIDFYTDVRSEKIRQLIAGKSFASVSWLFYESKTKIQLRFDGHAEVIDGDEADAIWQHTALDSRASYLSIRPPGERVDEIQPPSTDDRMVSKNESERGRANFRVVRTQVQRIDWLYLRRGNHVRATIDYHGDGRPDSCWVIP